MPFLEAYRSKHRERRLSAAAVALHSADVAVRKAAVGTLVRLRPVPVETLTQVAIHDPHLGVRGTAADALVRLRPVPVDALTQVALHGGGQAVREAAIDALVRLRPVPLDALTQVALHGSDKAVQALAVVRPLPVDELTQVARGGSTTAIRAAALHALFQDSAEGISIIKALGDRKDPGDVWVLIECLDVDLDDKSSGAQLRREIIKALALQPNRRQMVTQLLHGLHDYKTFDKILLALDELADPLGLQGLQKVYKARLADKPEHDLWADPPNVESDEDFNRRLHAWQDRQRSIAGVLEKHGLMPGT
jgi:hypothetical protein